MGNLEGDFSQENTPTFIFPYKQVNGDHEWLIMTNAIILCDLIWKVQKSHGANREGSFNCCDKISVCYLLYLVCVDIYLIAKHVSYQNRSHAPLSKTKQETFILGVICWSSIILLDMKHISITNIRPVLPFWISNPFSY